MKELIDELFFVKKALNWRITLLNNARYENDIYPLSFAEKLGITIESLVKIDNLKELIHAYSSYSYGTNLLNSVFPKFDNPEEFHSRNGVIALDEHPVQVMSWDQYEAQVKLGVGTGLSREYIIFGFNTQAQERGIDLEWHFHAEARTNTASSHPALD